MIIFIPAMTNMEGEIEEGKRIHVSQTSTRIIEIKAARGKTCKAMDEANRSTRKPLSSVPHKNMRRLFVI